MARGLDKDGFAQVSYADPNQDSEVVAFDGSVASSALNEGIHKITVTEDCFMAHQAASPTAVANGTDEFMAKGSIQFVYIAKTGNKLAFISNGTAGNAYITPYV